MTERELLDINKSFWVNLNLSLNLSNYPVFKFKELFFFKLSSLVNTPLFDGKLLVSYRPKLGYKLKEENLTLKLIQDRKSKRKEMDAEPWSCR